MAELIDVNDEIELQDDEQLDMFDNEPQEEATIEEQPEEEELPEKYQNKSLKDIVRMHQEAEKLLGRQSSEVGELRKVVDNYIISQSKVTQQPTQDEEEVDFFADPEKYTQQAIAKHPKMRELDEMTANMRKQTALSQLQQAHPDFQTVLTTPEFQDWVRGSKVRLELYARADQAYDFDSANELISTWKERQGAVQMTREVEANEIKRQRKAATTGSGKGGGEGKSRKVYRRSDIINLMQRDPDRYAELADEIVKAYQEGRVKG